MKRIRWSVAAIALAGASLALAAALPTAHRGMGPADDVRAHFEYWTRDAGSG
ncbi:MAG TPA: hypothetical protein VK845_04880 [Gemmatimonadales bacterium]|nr:hypothetical protein [Gemmatimonadales bacterium]